VIPHAITARFDCNSKLQPCLEGTRQDVLYKIHQWIDHDMASPATENMVSCAENLQTAHIFWLNGPGSAGTGKTTIAYTIAKELHSQQKLGASFFCSRSRGECSNPKLIFPTIAYQLGQFYAPFGKVATAVVTSDPEVVYSVEHMQLEKLIVKPLEALQDAIPPCVVVIDGLDECQDGGATSTILASLAQYINKLVPLKFLITSRPDHHVFNGFEQSPLNQVTKRLVLHEIEPTVVATDIQLFLKSSLKATRQLYRLDELWPSEQEVNTLVQLSSGLFIFAATAIRFIHHESYNDPQGQLACLLSAVVNSDYSAPKLLDWLYLQVLTNAYPDISAEFAGRLRLVLGSIIYLQNPLSASDIEWLLKPTISLQTTLRHLHSIVIFPSKQHESIQLIHPSFKDFLADPTRCSNPKFLVNTKMQLAQSCLNAMKILKRNICGLEPWMTHSEVVNFPALLQQYIPPALRYACCYWASHFSQALLTDELLDLLEDFCKSHLLHWVEVCSLLGELRNVLVALKTVQQSLLVSFI
jgi:NACHT domain